jgi:PAS domain S-box-containing protein
MEIGGGQMFVFLRDITERKRAEEVLRESEARYRTILENIQDGYFEVDLAGNCTFANEARCQSLGYTKEELIGMNNRQFVEKETSKKVFEVFNRVYRTGEPVGGLDEEVIRKDGTKASSEISISLIRDLKGDPIGFRGISRDITGRKRAENALRIEKQRFQTLLENAPFGMVMIDKEGNFKYINSKFIELFGYDLNDVPNGREWFNKAYPDPEYRHHAIDTWINDSNIYELGEKIPRIFTVTCKDRTKKIVRLITVQLEMGEYLLSCEDITMIQQAEEQKAALEEQLRQSQRVEAVGRLAGGIAHEFNNLMTVIEGYGQLSLKELSLIEKLKENDSLRENVEEILKASQRATDLTSQFLSFSRRQIMDMKVIDLNSLLGGLDKMLRLFIGEHIELAIILAEDLGRVKIDPGQFEQVILNLALNARDAMPGGGRLIIETQNVEINDSYVWTHVGTSPGQYVMFSLTDTGCGMSPEIKTHIFEPFFTTKEIGKGVGLGLATVYGIVKQSCGNIWVYSEPGQGTTFKIYLPRIDEAIESSRPCPAHMELPKGSETILLVEDEEPVRSVARKILNSYGYRVLEAVNGEQALHLAEGYTDKIHLLFTDVVMPQMSGKELAGKLKALRPDIKVLFASGYTDNAIVYHGLLYPGTNFLQKPFSPEALAQKVREVLGRRE